jgi:hypothetical protein
MYRHALRSSEGLGKLVKDYWHVIKCCVVSGNIRDVECCVLLGNIRDVEC